MGEGNSAGHTFISYVREDSPEVDRLQRVLESAGVRVWRDTAELWPGQDWREHIRKAITDDALIFIACFSSNSLAREKTYQNEELLLAIEQLRRRQPGVTWLIPVRFDECEIPDLDLGGGRTLSSIQRADLFGDSYDQAAARLVRVVENRLGSLSSTTPAAGIAGPVADDGRRLTPGPVLPVHGTQDRPNDEAAVTPPARPAEGNTPMVEAHTRSRLIMLEKVAARVRLSGHKARWVLFSVLLGVAIIVSMSADQPDMTTTLRFPSWVSAVAFSPNGQLLASGTGDTDDKVTLWDIANPKKPKFISTLIGYTRTVRTIAFSPDGHLLATAGWDGSVALWDVTNPAQPSRDSFIYASKGMMQGLAFSPDGKILAAGDTDQRVFLWNVSNPSRLIPIGSPLLGQAGFIRDVAFSPDGRTLATASSNHLVTLWNVMNPAKPTIVGRLDSYSGFESAVVFSPDRKFLAAGSTNGTVILWNVTAPAEAVHVTTFTASTGDWVTGEAYSPNGMILATANRPDTAVLWDVSNPAQPRKSTTFSILTGRPRYVEAVAFSPNGRWLAIASYNHTVTIWPVPDYFR
jgi:WD40 repeat protein